MTPMKRSMLNAQRLALKCGWLLLILLSALSSQLSTSLVHAQTAQPKNVQHDGTASANLTSNLATGNKTLTISSGGNLTAAAGSTVNLSAGTVTLGAQSGASLTNLNASNLASGTVPAARLPAATTGAQGAVELATSAETLGGASAALVVTPAALTEVAAQFTPSLAKWLKGGISGKKIVLVGDSTTSNATALFTRLAYHQQVGGLLEGTTILNYGNNGATVDAFMADGVTYGITAAIAAAADVYVFCYGINNVRLGSDNATTLEPKIKAAIDALRAGVPTTCILLREPNTFLTTDPTSSGFVSPLGSAATYSGYLGTVYNNLANYRPDVVLLSTRRLVFNTTPATSGMMQDIIHPNDTGYIATADVIAAALGAAAPYSQGQATAAKTSSYATPWSIYYRTLEDTKYYKEILSGAVVTSGSGFIRISFTDPALTFTSIGVTDVVAPAGLQPFPITTTNIIRNTTGVVQIGMTSPVSLTDGMPVKIYRDLFLGDANVGDYLQRTITYPYRARAYSTSAGNGYIDVGPMSPTDVEAMRLLTVADTLVGGGLTIDLASGTAATFSVGNPYTGDGIVRISKTGTDFSSLVNKGFYFFGAARQKVVYESGPHTLTNKTINGASNTLTVRAASDITGVLPSANGGAGTVSGLVKANGSGTTSAAVAATDYVAPGAATTSGLTQATGKLIGRTTASTGALEEITPNATNFTFSGGALNTVQDIATGSSPQFANVRIGTSGVLWKTNQSAYYLDPQSGANTNDLNAVSGQRFLTGGTVKASVGSGGLAIPDTTTGVAIARIRHGTATLSSGTFTVTDANTTANTRIFVNRLTDGGTVGAGYSVTRSASTSFTITSKDGSGSTQTSDTSVVAWIAIEP